MQQWFEIVGVFILTDIGIILGLLTKKLKKHFWLLGYIIPLVLIILIALTRHVYWLVFYPPFSWVSAGRMEYVIFAFAIPMLFATLIPRLDSLRLKVLVLMLVTAASMSLFIIPFISPILVRKQLRNLEEGSFFEDVYIQTTDYTCGPASAVNALYELGIKASEGEIAILAYTSPRTGTSDDLLAKAIEKRYSSEGITCTYRRFKSVAELRGNCPVIVVTKYSFLIDHYVTVIKVTDDKIIIANPSTGREVLTYDEFKDKWRSVGIVLRRVSNNE
jgi:predicted double-glycine peptidase